MLTTSATNTNLTPPAGGRLGAARPRPWTKLPGTPGRPGSADTGVGVDGPPGRAPRSPPASPGRPAVPESGTATPISGEPRCPGRSRNAIATGRRPAPEER